MQTETILFSLLASEVCGRPVSEDVKAVLSPELLKEVCDLSQKHDLAHIAGQALSKLGALGEDEISQKLKKYAMQAVYRYVSMNYEYQRVCKTLETAKIPFIPLKGSVLRNWYPEPWMRTSCDIDILVHEEDVQPAIRVLSETIGYQFAEQHLYEYSLFSPNGIHLELHSNTIEKVDSKARESVLMTVWETSAAENGWTYKRVLPDDMFYFYHILHMAKHFEHGGCGVRPFLDLWILNHRMPDNREKREALLVKGELTRFATAAETLSEVWFSGRASDALSEDLSTHILGAGIYGSTENRIAASRAKGSGKLSYILSRLFPPHSDMQAQYPVLRKHKWLTPFYVVVRWFRPILRGRFLRSVGELKVNAGVSQEHISSTAQLLEQLGL